MVWHSLWLDLVVVAAAGGRVGGKGWWILRPGM